MKCNCGSTDLVPGEDDRYKCLGIPKPEPVEIGSEEWKQEMRESWEMITSHTKGKYW